MKNLVIPKNYDTGMSIKETEIAIKLIKDFFEKELANSLNLTRVSAPLFVFPSTGLNDNLNGVERPVSFDMKNIDCENCEIVHSLAKWKRLALKRYGFNVGEGLYTDMNAIRRDEDTDNLHSIYVDQWDWESVIKKEQRNEEVLKTFVRKIYEVLKKTEKLVFEKYPHIKPVLPDDITFIKTSQLEEEYPNLSAKEREHEAVKKYGAVFLMQIGGKLKSGKPHDGRAPDYDDWSLNGDIIVNYPLLDIAFEISSMGIRVDADALKNQLEISGCMERAKLPFQSALLKNEIPFTIGGGIGQSRLCMFFLRRAHIGEVQASVWSDDELNVLKENNINIL